MKPAENERKATLIFDGSCPVCSGTVKWIGENQREGAFEMAPCQSDVMTSQFPDIRRSECMRAMHIVLPDGTVLVGEQALPEIFLRLRRYRFAAMLFKLPGAAMLSRIAYFWFADRRYRIAAFLSHLSGTGKHAA